MYRIKEGCPDCGNCRNICPVEAIIPGPSLGMVINDKCIDCGVCAAACPVNLIEAAPAVQTAAATKSARQKLGDKEAEVNA